MNITFRESTENDALLIRNWIKTNEFTRKWYYSDKIPRLDTLRKKLIGKINDSNTKAMIAMADNKEFGYVQCYPADGQGAWSKKVKVYDNTASIDYFIGDIKFIHKGCGQRMILEFIEQIIKPLGYEYVMISPDPQNTASIRCCKKCGFEYAKTVNVPYINSKNKEAVYIRKVCFSSLNMNCEKIKVEGGP